jgi:hypothetical protein
MRTDRAQAGQVRTATVRSRGLVVILAAAALLASSGQALAADPEPTKIDLLGCLEDGVATVDAGTPFVVDIFWGATSWHKEIKFLFSQRAAAWIDDVRIHHPNWYWGMPQKTYPWPDLAWSVSWDYPVDAMAAGESITFGYKLRLKLPVFDGVDHYPRGLLLERSSCTISAV